MEALPRTKSCFVCGVDNPIGVKLRFFKDGDWVRAEFRPRAEHAGFHHTVHGGITATVLDEVMVWAIGASTGRFAYSAELTIRYTLPVRTGELYRLSARLTANRKGRIFETLGELRDEAGHLAASATAKYLPVPVELEDALQVDFAEDASALWARRDSAASSIKSTRPPESA